MSTFTYHASDDTVSVMINGYMYGTDRTNPSWPAIKEALNDPNTTEEELIRLIRPINAVADALADVEEVTVQGGRVYYGDEELHNALATRVLDILNEGLNIESWVKFAQNIYSNPFVAAREELYEWLEAGKMPITPDGCFIAYKLVRADYMDGYSGTFDNHVGQVVVMKGGRDAVDADRRRTCSHGLHFCSRAYLPQYGVGNDQRVMLVKVNPADVVAIPADAGLSKGRTWRYEVVGELAENRIPDSWAAVAASHGDDSWDAPEDDADDAPAAETASEPSISTANFGVITRSRLQSLLADAGGSVKALADTLGAPPATVGTWKRKLLGSS